MADGQSAYEKYSKLFKGKEKVILKQVDLGFGIHAMWNLGIDVAVETDTAVVFINDDIILGDNCAGTLASLVAYDKSLGVVSPAYDYRKFTDIYQEVETTAGGRSDGTGGLGGFCMALSRELTKEWRFDESMKWWYGDDDILMWTINTKHLRPAVTSIARCSGNSSLTINTDPPPNFVNQVLNDKLIFCIKWDLEDTNAPRRK